MEPRVIIPTGLGINSHEELAYCFRVAGAKPEFRLLNDLIENPSLLDSCQGLGLPGGFSMGDHPFAGQSIANRIRDSGLYEKLREKFEDQNVPIYCVCNFFQVVGKLDLSPIPVGTLQNDVGKHQTQFWDLAINPNHNSVWLTYLKKYDGPLFAPNSHGEGRVYMTEEGLDQAKMQNMIALTYVQGAMSEFFGAVRPFSGYNPNGSVGDIAGIGWKNNLLLFPHFERLHRNVQRPDRYHVGQKKATINDRFEPTYLLFKAAVDFMRTGSS